jgi:hypothetical protein
MPKKTSTKKPDMKYFIGYFNEDGGFEFDSRNAGCFDNIREAKEFITEEYYTSLDEGDEWVIAEGSIKPVRVISKGDAPILERKLG